MSRVASLQRLLERIRHGATESGLLASYSTIPNENKALRPVLDALNAKTSPPKPQVDRINEQQKQVYRLSNASVPGLEGMWVVGRVIETDSKRALVETGLPGSPHVFKKTELDVRKVVGTTGTLTRSTRYDIKEGDTFHLRVQKLSTPFGEPWLTLEKVSMEDRRKLVWKELRRRFETGETVAGRVLNTSANARGFIVGIAGFLCYLPASRCSLKTSRKVGILQDFKIITIDEANAMVVLCEPAFRDRSLREILATQGQGQGQGLATQGAAAQA